MFSKIAAFEFRYQLKSPVFWVAVVLFFLLTFASQAVEHVHIGGDNSNIHKNAPYAIAMTHLVMAVFYMFASTAIVANVVVRDDESGFGAILRSSRIRKRDYLYGRFLGAFAAISLGFLSVPLGAALGSSAPWLDRETIGPIDLFDYAYDYFWLGLPTVFLTSALFFALATATRSMSATYVAMVALLFVWSASLAATDKPELEQLMAYLEPFGLGAFTFATKYWTVAERNSLNPGFGGVLLWSRLIWLSVALTALASAHVTYRFTAGIGRRANAKPEAEPRSAPRLHPVLPAAPRRDSSWSQFLARLRMDFSQVFGSPAFFSLLALGVFNALNSLWYSQGLYDTDIYPVTRVFIGTLFGSFTFVPVIIAVYYAGDLVWRERDRRTEEIIESTPAPNWTFVAPKIIAIILVLMSTLLTSVFVAVGVQLLKGWGQVELDKYLIWYVFPVSIRLSLVAVLAVFVQALTPHKLIGYAVMLVYMIFVQIMSSLHLDDFLYRYAGSPPVPLSDMNGEGRFGAVRLWFEAYWLAIGGVLTVLTFALWRRGQTAALIPRLLRLPRVLGGAMRPALAALVLSAVSLGGVIYYNTHILNAYHTSEDDDRWLADFERILLPFQSLPQPKITDVKLVVELDPHRNRASTRGVYELENRSAVPIRELHVRFDRKLSVVSLSVEGARPKQTFERFNYRIFALDAPMQPGERRQMSFATVRTQRGFANDDNGWTRIHDNGTFLDDRDIAPSIGMDQNGLLTDRAKRRKFGLPAQLRPPKLEDVAARQWNMLGRDADWVKADITVSTTPDQTPMAPGYKVSDRLESGRRVARFVTEAPIQRFFSVQSAAYAVKTERYKGVDLSIYFHPAHHWNVDRMIRALKVGLDYNQSQFGPYQFRQVRVLEFPAYADFAQSFANTIPYSENLGWIVDARDPNKIDMTTYVTAHELAHQWWAHQVIGADVQGATMLDETLAQYSALMTMETLSGPPAVRKFLRFELDRYLRARGGDRVEELPLERVENQPYIHYRKGSLVMYRLKEELGAERVNAALRTFLERNKFKGAPYPTAKELVDLFRAQARPDQQEMITDLFEKITLYDLRVISARSTRRADGRSDVAITYEAHKVYADGQGRETEAPMTDVVDFGVFRRDPQKDKFSAADVVSVRRIPVQSGVHTVNLTVEGTGAFAGIDPYNKLIDRKPDAHISAVRR